MVGCTFILRGSSCKGYFYACLSLSSTTGNMLYLLSRLIDRIGRFVGRK